ncbi:J domain-containing protein [Bartonella sp. TP]|uniref:J domain-containing protein n=1 Tax=Bartonella sp. TP TaxID=3057550 RepID=UPI0025B04F08|nr:J domain-containing protein [Bartonella sp. TP]WJW79520.1 J domain-containing protein [Bartonella sp. TP]
MAIKSKYFDSIRINSTRKSKETPPERLCAFKGCTKEGIYRAPASREADGKYLYFCLEHIREYNKNFNFFEGLDPEDIGKFQHQTNIGERPTWPSGAHLNRASLSSDFANLRSGSARYQNMVNSIYRKFGTPGAADSTMRQLNPQEKRSFEALGLQPTATADQIVAKYKALVKAHHPDANGGDRSQEQRFNEILQAYKLLKKNKFC